MMAARVAKPDVPSVRRRCVAPAAFLLIGLCGVTWMADPAHVPSNINRVGDALQRVHPTHDAASDAAALPPLTPAERSVQAAGKIGSVAGVSIAASVLALLFGILAGPSPRPWLFRLHRWSRFVALCLTVPLVALVLVELSPGAAIFAIDLLPFMLPLSLVLGLAGAFLLSRSGSAGKNTVRLVSAPRRAASDPACRE